MYGLLDRDLKYITQTLSMFPEIKKAIIFGSRAMGNYKKGSDIDLVICGGDINKEILLKVYDYLDEVYPIPYFLDIIHYENIDNDKLKDHIDKNGKVIYVKSISI